MLTRIISGGQTGADQGGLEAARSRGIPTGGMIPRGFRTENGSDPSLGSLYGLKEHNSHEYPPRTFANAKEGDGTIRFASDFNTQGEQLTLNAISRYKKPHIDVDVRNPIPHAEVAKWIRDHDIRILNVAGNAESRFVGIQQFVAEYLDIVIDLLNDKEM